MKKPILEFKGKYRFLSNFYRYPLLHQGLVFRTAEHAYQCAKIAHHGDMAISFVKNADTPGAAKKLVRNLSIPADWDSRRVGVMLDILRAKFARHLPSGSQNLLRSWLDGTEDCLLVEGNAWGDTFWGQCPIGEGENMLGKLLMQVRGEIRG